MVWMSEEMTNSDVGNMRGIRTYVGQLRATLNNVQETSKRVEETAGWIAVTLACVAVVSIAALGLAAIALIGNTRRKGVDVDAG